MVLVKGLIYILDKSCPNLFSECVKNNTFLIEKAKQVNIQIMKTLVIQQTSPSASVMPIALTYIIHLTRCICSFAFLPWGPPPLPAMPTFTG